MKKLILFLLLLCSPALAQVAQTGAGPGAPGVAYQGPGDVLSGAISWGSCARVYKASLASTSTNLCDLVQASTGASPGTSVGTLRGSASGFVDLSAYFSGSVTPATACGLITGGCVVSKVYDQTGTTNHFTQATVANMPGLVFSALNSLPGIQCGSPAIMATPNITQAQPFSLSAVYIRTGGTTGLSPIIGALSGGIDLEGNNVANQARITAGTAVQISNVADNSWHSFEGAFASGGNGGANIDGTDSPSLTLGANVLAGNALRICADGSSFLTGKIMEAGIWPSAFTAPQRGNISSNQHSPTNGYNF